MRKHALHTFALPAVVSLFLAQNLFAQNTSPYWSLAGNSNATTSSKLGTTTAIPLRLFTNNAVRVTVSPNVGNVGIGMTSPTSRLQVNGSSGASPFRVQINNDTKLYMNSGGGLSVGSGSGAPTNGLYVNGKVGIGTNTPAYKLQVEGGTGTAIYANTTGTGTYGVFGNSYGTGVYGQGGTIGVEGYAPGGLGYGQGVYGHSSYIGVNGSAGSYGVYGTSTNSSGGFGVYGTANNNSGTGVYGTGYYGVRGISNTGFGVDAIGYYVGVVGHGSNLSSSSFGTEGYGNTNGDGVYGTAGAIGVQGYATNDNSKGIYGSATGKDSYAGYFNGLLFATTYSGSDSKLKKNIEDVRTAMDIINQLHPKMYEFRQDGNYKYMHLPEGKHYGLIAQELEQVLPTLVKDTKFDTRVEQLAQAKAASGGTLNPSNSLPPSEVIDFKAVNYTELIPILIKGMQEQSELIKQQQVQIDDLKTQVSRLSGNSNIVTSVGTLGQNTPNPVRTTTRISYSVPSTSRAQLLLTDALGKTVKVVSLNNSGYVNLNAAGLSSGMYNYSLMVDGKIVESKKMEVVR